MKTTDIMEHEFSENHSFVIWNKDKCNNEKNWMKIANIKEEDYAKNHSIVIYEDENCYNKRNRVKVNTDFWLKSYWK